jgi:hypothetical protein
MFASLEKKQWGAVLRDNVVDTGVKQVIDVQAGFEAELLCGPEANRSQAATTSITLCGARVGIILLSL